MLDTGKERICGGLSIAKSMARGHPKFYGAKIEETNQVDQWIDYICQHIAPVANKIGDLARGNNQDKSDIV